MTDQPFGGLDVVPVAPIYAHYTGGGFSGYLAGLPAVDMTRDEWEKQDQALRDLALQLKLYEITPAATQTLEAIGAAADAEESKP